MFEHPMEKIVRDYHDVSMVLLPVEISEELNFLKNRIKSLEDENVELKNQLELEKARTEAFKAEANGLRIYRPL